MKNQSTRYQIFKKSLAAVLTLALILAFAPVAIAAPDDVISFTDANLKQAFLDAGADTNNDGQITQGDLAALTGSINLSSRNIENISEIAFATGITEINLSNNNISDISALTALTGLTDANVSNNYLDISSGSSDLTVIDALIANGTATIYSPQNSIITRSFTTESITISETNKNICVGDSFTLTADISPSGSGTTWSSSNASVAAVSNGVVNALSFGTAVITATSTADGLTASCTVNVSSGEITSSIYEITCGVLCYVSPYTSAAQLIANLSNDSGNLAVFSGGSEYPGVSVGTGMKVRLTISGTLRDEVTVVTIGDVNGDGFISITDYTMTRLDILNMTNLSGMFVNAADVDGNGLISISDYTLLRLHILNLKAIKGSTSDLPGGEDPRIQALIDFALTQLGKPYVGGGKGPDSFDCSGFVYYCLNSIGYKIGYMTSTMWRSANYHTIDVMSDIKKGDILCFYGHVAIYMGDGMMVDASSSNGMIVTRSNIFGSSYWTENFVCAKRLF